VLELSSDPSPPARALVSGATPDATRPRRAAGDAPILDDAIDVVTAWQRASARGSKRSHHAPHATVAGAPR
jgi:hypothetical protein